MAISRTLENPSSNNDQTDILALAGPAICVADSSTSIALYSMFLSPFLHEFFKQFGRYIFFPIFMGIGFINTVLAYRNTYVANYEPLSVMRFLIEAVSFSATLVLGAAVLAGSVAIGAAAPFVFASLAGIRALFHIGLTAYHGYQTITAKDRQTRNEQLIKTAENAAIVTACILGVAATVLVMIYGLPALAGVGIAAGCLGLGFGAFKLAEAIYNHVKNKKTKSTKPTADETLEQPSTDFVNDKNLSHRTKNPASPIKIPKRKVSDANIARSSYDRSNNTLISIDSDPINFTPNSVASNTESFYSCKSSLFSTSGQKPSLSTPVCSGGFSPTEEKFSYSPSI